MADKSSNTTSPETTPQGESATTTISRGEMMLALDLMINRRKGLGEYNTDAGDILLLAKILRATL